MSRPKYSICVPVYNGASYLADCLHSIKDQHFDNYEVIVVDDRSTDESATVIEKFMREDKRIRFIKNEKNLGLVGNWNKCISLASGEWIKFLFQDDVMKPGCLKQLDEATESGAKVIVCEREYFFENDVDAAVAGLYQRIPRLGKLLKTHGPQLVRPKELASIAARRLPSNFVGEPSSLMFHRSLIADRGYDSRYTQIVDLEFVLRHSFDSGLYYLPEKLIGFRIHGRATTQSNNSKKYFATQFADVIRLFYSMMHDEAFAGFRKHVSAIRMLRFQLYLLRTIHKANRFATFSSDPATKQEYDELMHEFERLKRWQRWQTALLPLWLMVELKLKTQRVTKFT